MNRLALIFSFACFAVLGNAFSLPNSRNEEALFLRRIADFWEEGEYAIAKRQMEEFLAGFPESAYANTLRMTLGDLFFRENNVPEALRYYSEIQDPALADKIFLKRMQCLYQLKWHATLADECEAYLERTTDGSERLEVAVLLITALYEQSLNAGTETLAKRGEPYFELLSRMELSPDVAGAIAHLRCLLQDFEGAAKTYLDLAKQDGGTDEPLFQAALLQSKYDPTLALETFQALIDKKGSFAESAAYNRLVLCFNLGHHEEIVLRRDEWYQLMAEDKRALAHVFIGQSCLHLNECNEAAVQFDAVLQSDLPMSLMQQALPHIVEVAYRTDNLALLDRAIAKWGEDPATAGALFTRAEMLKKQGQIEEARTQLSTLLDRFPQFSHRPEACFALIQLEASSGELTTYRQAALTFLREYASHEKASAAWRHFLLASTELAQKDPEWGTQLIQDLEAALIQAPSEDKLDLQLRLAKAYFDIGSVQESLNLVEPLCLESNMQGNAELLLAICYRDGLQDHALFCEWAERALSNKATLLSEADQHIALFNAYLIEQPEGLELMAHHLTEAFALNAPIELPNLLWLADFTYEQFLQDPSHAVQAMRVIGSLLERSPDVIVAEPFLVKQARLLVHCNRSQEAIDGLESLDAKYRENPELDWQCQSEARLLLAESLLAAGSSKLAESLFDMVAGSSLLQDRFAATAALQSARIKQSLPEADANQILTMLKNIFLQRTLANEPVHLEAAMDYVDFLSRERPLEKQLDLLVKTQENLEANDDLLSMDYHAARKQDETHNQIYLDYMNYLSAQISLTKAKLKLDPEQQKALQANAEEFLLRISQSPCAPLQQRLHEIRSQPLEAGV